MNTAWIYLVVAGILEVVWAVGLKSTFGFTRLWPSVFTLSFMFASFFLLSLALKQLPIGTAYAVWTGIGATGAALVHMLFLGESRELARIACVLLIVSGVVGLKLLAKPAV